MSIKNITKKTKVSNNYKIVTSIIGKSLGLMFKTKAKTLIFQWKKELIAPLHMFFVFFTIDILYLNKEKKVVEIKQNFKPFTFYNPRNKAEYIIELPKNSIKNSKTEVNDSLSW